MAPEVHRVVFHTDKVKPGASRLALQFLKNTAAGNRQGPNQVSLLLSCREVLTRL